MIPEQPLQSGDPTPEQIAKALDDLHLAVNFHCPYLRSADAAVYMGRRTVKAFLEFRRRLKGTRLYFEPHGDGTWARRDLDRIKRQTRLDGRGCNRIGGRPSSQSRSAE